MSLRVYELHYGISVRSTLVVRASVLGMNAGQDMADVVVSNPNLPDILQNKRGQ